MEDLKKYIFKNTKDKIIITVAGTIFCLIGIVSIVTRKSLLIGIVFVLLGALTAYGGLTSSKSDEKALETIKKEGKIDEVINDFKRAKSYLNDDVRFGEKYIFRKKDSRIVKYEDILEVEYVSTISTIDEAPRTVYYLSVTLKNNKSQSLYNERGDHKEVADEMIDLILKYNPIVVVKEKDA